MNKYTGCVGCSAADCSLVERLTGSWPTHGRVQHTGPYPRADVGTRHQPLRLPAGHLQGLQGDGLLRLRRQLQVPARPRRLQERLADREGVRRQGTAAPEAPARGPRCVSATVVRLVKSVDAGAHMLGVVDPDVDEDEDEDKYLIKSDDEEQFACTICRGPFRNAVETTWVPFGELLPADLLTVCRSICCADAGTSSARRARSSTLRSRRGASTAGSRRTVRVRCLCSYRCSASDRCCVVCSSRCV